MSKVISVWGSPNSGKTTLACGIAIEISSKKNNVAIVCCDDLTPTIPSIFPQDTKNIYDKTTKTKSIGKILSLTAPSDNDFYMQFTTVNNIGRIILVGYAYGEGKYSYPMPTDHDIYGFYGKLEDMVDYIIIDCTSRLDNRLASISLQNSDVVVRACGTGYKDLVFFASNLQNVPARSVALNSHINVFAMAKNNDAVDEVRAFYGNIDYIIKYDRKIKEITENGELLLSPFPKNFRKNISEMVEGMDFVG